MKDPTWATTIEDLENLYDTLDLKVVVRRTLNYLSTKIECRNILWVLQEELTSIQKSNGSYVPESTLDREVMLSAQSEITDKMAIFNLRQFDVSESFYESTDLQPLKMKTADGTYNYLVPIRDPKTHYLLASLMFVGINGEKKSAFEERVMQIFKTMNRHVAFSVEYYRVKCLSFVDDVTSLYNQRFLPIVLENEISRSRRNKGEFSVLFLDVDYFKMVNDTRGHVIGSKILIEMAELLKKQIRTNDYAFRYGGDEFVIILIDTGTDKAQVVAERIRSQVESTVFNVEGPDIQVTVSIGVAGFPQHAKSSEHVIQLADQAMYDAKNKSRNVVYVTAS